MSGDRVRGVDSSALDETRVDTDAGLVDRRADPPRAATADVSALDETRVAAERLTRGAEAVRTEELDPLGATRDASALGPARPLGEAPALRRRLGRYELLERIGQGGMGVVFRAHDPELQRDLAIKIMAERRSHGLRLRMVREAQALAKLQHPNVVAIHDVGDVDGQLFIAMELIPGETLDAWIERTTPSRRELLEMFVAAGRGLAAAHAVGLVHRDFKPSNVLVGSDGRPRILDFGLARGAEASELADDIGDAEDVDRRGLYEPLSQQLTHDGAIVGTPAYMSPEQFTGRTADARSDQFSYCVALYEALYGRRPFVGETLDELGAALVKGELPRRPAGRRVPRWLDEAVTRGLAARPEDRWPSMEPLIARLSRDPARRVMIGAAVLASLVGVGAAGYLAASPTEADPCGELEGRLVGAWDRDAVDAAARAFEASPLVYARDTWTRVRPALDDYAARWVEGYRRACEAHLRRERSDTLHDYAMRCLQRRRAALASAGQRLASGDPSTLERAPTLVASLPEIERCDDLEALQSRFVAPLRDAEAVERARERVDELVLDLEAGGVQRVRDELDALADEVEELAHPPLSVSYWWLYARCAEQQLGGDPVAMKALRRAMASAIEGGDERGVMWIAADLALMSVRSTHRDALVGAYADLTRAYVARAGEAAAVEATLGATEARLALQTGEFARASETIERALEFARGLDERRWPTKLNVFMVRAQVAMTTGQRDAIDVFDDVLELQARHLGPRHPKQLDVLSMRGTALIPHDPARALETLERADALANELYGELYADRVTIYLSRGFALDRMGDLEGALASAEEARALKQRMDSGRDEFDVQIDNSIGVLLDRMGRHDEAVALLSPLPKEQVERANSEAFAHVIRMSLADALLHRGDADAAAEQFGLALEHFRETAGADGPMTLYAENGLALVELAQGRHARARERFERVLAARLANESAPEELGLTRFGLARALWSLGERGRARALAETAASDYAAAAGGHEDQRAEVQRWLDERGA